MDWKYLTGFFDGEGCIFVKDRNKSLITRLTIVNTHKQVMVEIKEFLNKELRINKKMIEYPPIKINWKTKYLFEVCDHKSVLCMLKKMKKHSIVKIDQIEQAIKKIENRKWQGELISKEKHEKLY